MKPVTCIETGITYSSAAEVYKLFKISCTSCCKGDRKTAGGFH